MEFFIPSDVPKIASSKDHPIEFVQTSLIISKIPSRWTDVPKAPSQPLESSSTTTLTTTRTVVKTRAHTTETLFTPPPTILSTLNPSHDLKSITSSGSNDGVFVSATTSVTWSTGDASANATQTTSTPNPSVDGLPGGSIAAITVSIAFAASILGSGLWLWMRRRRRHKISPDSSPRPPLHEEDSYLGSTGPSPHDIDTGPSSPGDWPSHQEGIVDPRILTWQGIQSPTPKPAVAEVRSFTRAWQKPRMCDIGQRPVAELPGKDATRGSQDALGHIDTGGPDISPISPTDWLYGNSSPISPISATNHGNLPLHTGDWMPPRSRQG